MNEAFFKHAMLCIKRITKDSIQMYFKTNGVIFENVIIPSRNSREGRYLDRKKKWKVS